MLAILFNLTIFDGLGLFWLGDFFEFLTNVFSEIAITISGFPDFCNLEISAILVNFAIFVYFGDFLEFDDLINFR